MTKTTVRILVVAILLIVVYCGANIMREGLSSSNVQLPRWDVNDLPVHIGDWEGEEAEVDPNIVRQLGAHSSINRNYRRSGKKAEEFIALHVAIFDEYDDATASHNPANCYRSSGWELLSDAPLRIEGVDGEPISIALSKWEMDGRRVTVAHWYQLGKHVATNRVELGKVRWNLRGGKKWPALVKVQIHTTTDDVDRSEEGVEQLASFVYRWLNDPDFRTSCAIIDPGENEDPDPETGS